MKTILSIDGGGVRGIIPLACLARLEAERGKPSHEIFDMVAGTSTGSIISAGIALGLSARAILNLYRSLSREAFQHLPWWQVLFNLGNHRYSNAFIAEVLNRIGADIPLNRLPIDVMITAKNTQSGSTDFFVRDNPMNAALWGTLSLKDAVLASIAAPTYFPSHSAAVLGNEYVWVDGGVGVSGNPCYQAAVEALHFGAGHYQAGDTLLLSFGTGRSPHQINAKKANIIQWGAWVLQEVLEDSSDWQTYVTRREYDATGLVDFRRYQLDLAPDVMTLLDIDIPPEVDVRKIALDSVWAIDLLDQIGRAFALAIDFEADEGLDLRSSEPQFASHLTRLVGGQSLPPT